MEQEKQTKQESLKDEYVLLKTGKEFDAVVIGVSEPKEYEHPKYGKKKYVVVQVQFDQVTEELKLFLPGNRMLNPNSNAGKILKQAKVERLSLLVGKKVKVRVNKDGYLRFAVEHAEED
jgi:hypothetical protein